MGSENPVRPEAEEDKWDTVRTSVDDLYTLLDTYFPPNPDDKLSKLQAESDACLSLLDSIPYEQRKSSSQRALYEYLRGKSLDVFPNYRKEAEDHLSKAVKLNPSLADAWLCLGNTIWKKGDLTSAKNCFNLALSKGPNKKILCLLSMLERKMAQGAQNQAEIVDESIQHAKDAISLDVKDGNSWYNLGNAYLTSFFITGAWEHNKLRQALKAYQIAEKDERTHSNPDLFFNCATVNKYLENYERALTGFEAAALRDPSLDAAEEVQKMVNLLDRIQSLLRVSRIIHAIRNQFLSFSDLQVKSPYKEATIDVLAPGLNKSVMVAGKVLFFVKHDDATPLYYVVCDSNHASFVLSVYGVRNEAIKEGDRIALLEPHCHHLDFSWKAKHYDFKSIRVDFVEQVVVNGKPLTAHHAVSSSIYAQHKP
ncbi:Tetratricopeptide repeat protein 5 [Linum perenne]